jgi:hypothetical protein
MVADVDLNAIAIEAMRLQNGYGFTVDARDWTTFRTHFTNDVIARYPHRTYSGLDDWVGDFEPMHDTYPWSIHAMSNHVVGQDADGVWAICYGRIRWTMDENPGQLNRAEVIFRDRLQNLDGRWLIAHRKLDVLLSHGGPLREGATFVHTVKEMADWNN